MSTRIFVLMVFYIMCNELIRTKKIEEIFICANETECDELIEKDALEELTSTAIESIYGSTSATDIISTQITKIETIPTMQTPYEVTNNSTIRSNTVHKVQSDACECDLTTSSCDINCCCDEDCTDFHVTVFSYCENHEAELYDKRYCYNRNFIERNNTPFTLEKLSNNLFCILYDNLPPTYSVTNDLHIKTETDLKAAINPKKLTWRWEDQLYVPEYNTSSPYIVGDIIWKVHNNYIQPFEIPQSGFTELCTFKKTINYLRGWKHRCLQTELINTNKFLFPTAFSNFTIITSPYLFNKTYFNVSDQICPRNVCLTLTNHYCKESWQTCNNTVISGSCLNATCYNIVTGVKYVIVHNGSIGINSIHVYFNIGNVSRDFYQQFEVVYEWADLDKQKSFSLSGNPGYMFKKPLFIGTLKVNKTNDLETRYVSFNKTNRFLTLPIATKSGDCNEVNNYTIAFAENIKLRCSVSLSTNNFSTSTCIELQNRTMHFLMKDTLFNITKTDQYNIYVSKSGNFTTNDTADWAQILLDRVPQNVVTGKLISDRLYCSGLITSMHLNILYAALPKPESLTNYNVLGIGITFSNESDVFWSKCMTENCTDILKVDIVNYVTFHDISKPSKYYFIEGPYLDLAMPFNFFYPFLSNSKCIKSNVLLISIVVFIVSLHSAFY